jgi:SAM-dependent methyltransferase
MTKQPAEFEWQPCTFDPRFSHRSYPSYEEYVTHQKSKLERLDLTAYDPDFRRALRKRLEQLDFLRPRMKALCLGARSGAEVKAFVDLWCSATGIDLNPPENSALVREGDFHDTGYVAWSQDVVYTNCLDHAFDILDAIEEISRVLRPEGFLIVEACPGKEEGAHLDEWDCFIWPTVDALVELVERSGFRLIRRESFNVPWRGEQLFFEKELGREG